MKRGAWLIVLAVAAVMAAVVTMCVNMPHVYDWTLTHKGNRDHPFGCQLMDSVLKHSLPAGYRVTTRTMHQAAHDSVLAGCDFLIVADSYHMNQQDAHALTTMLMEGHNVLIVSNSIHTLPHPCSYYEDLDVNEALQFKLCSLFEFDFDTFKESIAQKQPQATIIWDNHDKSRVPWQFCETIIIASPLWRTLAWVNMDSTVMEQKLAETEAQVDMERERSNDMPVPYYYNPNLIPDLEDAMLATPSLSVDAMPVAAEFTVFKGKLIVATTVHEFTNYGLLCGNDDVIEHLVSRLYSGRPVVRLDNYDAITSTRYAQEGSGGEVEVEKAPSMLSFLLENKPLRWALYTLLALIAVYMAFTARRKQRVIPVIKEPRNMTLDMAEHYGLLFYKRHDNANLLFKKYCLFGLELYRLLLIDIDDVQHIDEAVDLLAQVTMRDRDTLRRQLDDTRVAACGDLRITNKELRQHITFMNEVLRQVTQQQ